MAHMRCLRLLFAASLFMSFALAQAHHHQAYQTAPEIDLARLPAPVRMDGIGHSHIEIGTKSPEAQQWLDQGIALSSTEAPCSSCRLNRGFSGQLLVGELLNLRLQAVDVLDQRDHRLQLALIPRAEDLRQYFVEADQLLLFYRCDE